MRKGKSNPWEAPSRTRTRALARTRKEERSSRVALRKPRPEQEIAPDLPPPPDLEDEIRLGGPHSAFPIPH
jgi:hypothetical protein